MTVHWTEYDTLLGSWFCNKSPLAIQKRSDVGGTELGGSFFYKSFKRKDRLISFRIFGNPDICVAL